jgi:hypothetical protein
LKDYFAALMPGFQFQAAMTLEQRKNSGLR